MTDARGHDLADYGWRSITTMKRSYQLTEEAGVLEAVSEARKLREQGA